MGDVNDTAVFNEIDPLNNSINEPSFPEGMLPSLVNDNSRALMGAVKRFRDWLCAGSTVGGTANAVTLTFANSPYLLVKGDRYVFFPTAGNTDAVSLTVGGLATKAVQRNGAALAGGELSVGVPVEVIYDGTAFQLMPFLTSFNKLGIGTNTPVSTLSVGGIGASNWRTYIAGLTNTSSTFSLVIDDSAGVHEFYIRDDGIITFAKYGAGALFTDVIGDVGVGVLPVIYGGTGVQTSTGSGSNVLNTNPVLHQTTISANVSNALQIDNGASGNILKISGNNSVDTSFPSVRSDGTNLVLNAKASGGLYLNNDISGGNVYVLGNANIGAAGGSPNWRTFISGQGTTSATYQLVSDNSAGGGCLWVRDDGVISFPSYGNGTLQVSGGTVVSTANPTFGTTTTGNLTTSSIQCNGNFAATGNIACGFTVTATNSVNTTVYQLNGANFAQRASGAAGYMQLYDYNGNIAIFLGGGTDQTNYYRNTSHVFGSVNQNTLYGFWNSTGITVSTGSLTVASGQLNVNGSGIFGGTGNFGSSGSFGSDLQVNGQILNFGNINVHSPAAYLMNDTVAVLGLNPIGAAGGTPTVFMNDASNRTCILMGNSGAPQNFYFQQQHYIEDASGASLYLSLRSSDGLTTPYNMTANSFITSSDARLKENVSETGSTIDHLRSLRPVDFNWHNKDEPRQHGLIAQDVLATPFANLVRESKRRRAGMPHEDGADDEDTVLTMNYQGLIAPMVKAIQEIADRLDALEAPAKPTKKP